MVNIGLNNMDIDRYNENRENVHCAFSIDELKSIINNKNLLRDIIVNYVSYNGNNSPDQSVQSYPKDFLEIMKGVQYYSYIGKLSNDDLKLFSNGYVIDLLYENYKLQDIYKNDESQVYKYYYIAKQLSIFIPKIPHQLYKLYLNDKVLDMIISNYGSESIPGEYCGMIIGALFDKYKTNVPEDVLAKIRSLSRRAKENVIYTLDDELKHMDNK